MNRNVRIGNSNALPIPNKLPKAGKKVAEAAVAQSKLAIVII
jgi:hypothetical protein